MNLRPKLTKDWLGLVVALLIPTAIGLFLRDYQIGAPFTNASYDLLLISRGEIGPREAVIVYLDERSYQEFGQPLNVPLDRRFHALLVDRLTHAGAKAVVFDMVFDSTSPGPEGPAIDEEFARALRENKRVILAADLSLIDLGQKKVTRPLPLFREHASDGYAELQASADMVVREHTPADPNWFPTLSWAAADLVGAPITKDPAQGPRSRWLNYYGGINNLDWTTYHKALDTNAIADDFFRDKVIFVGARFQTKTFSDRKDEYQSPFSRWTNEKLRNKRGALFMAGVEIQATMFLNLLRGDWLTRLAAESERVFLVVIGAGFGLLLLRLRPTIATAVGLGGMVAVAAGSYFIFKQRLLWWPWLIAEIQIALALLWSIVFNSIQLYVQKRLLEQTLRFYLSPKLVKKIGRDPKMLKPGAEKELLTILFTDIANFTSISERMDSNELSRLMNNYFQIAVSHCIHKTDGTLVKYIGDAIFAFWNAPDRQSDHAVRACEAALHFRDQEVQYVNGQPLHTRIGMHTGIASVGNFGSTARVDYTAFGENINLASRMEGLNKHLGTTVLMTGDTKSETGDQFTTRPLGLFRLKGFERSVEVYEVIGWAREAPKSEPWRIAFASALEAFQRRDFTAAQTGFHGTMGLHALDGPSQFYLARIEEFRATPPDDHWKGEIELKEK